MEPRLSWRFDRVTLSWKQAIVRTQTKSEKRATHERTTASASSYFGSPYTYLSSRGLRALSPFYRLQAAARTDRHWSIVIIGVGRVASRVKTSTVIIVVNVTRNNDVCLCLHRYWNSLPVDVQSAPSLTTFRQKLKSHLFRQSYPDIVC